MEDKIKIKFYIYCNYKKSEITEEIESDNDAESVSSEISEIMEKYTNCDCSPEESICIGCDLFPCREPDLKIYFKLEGIFENSSLEKEG